MTAEATTTAIVAITAAATAESISTSAATAAATTTAIVAITAAATAEAISTSAATAETTATAIMEEMAAAIAIAITGAVASATALVTPAAAATDGKTKLDRRKSGCGSVVQTVRRKQYEKTSSLLTTIFFGVLLFL